MSRTILIGAVTGVVVAALAIGGALLLLGGGDTAPQLQPATSSAVPSPSAVPTPSAFKPVAIASGTPEYEQLLACLFSAGYRQPSADAAASELVMKGGDVPTLRFKVDAEVGTVSPAGASDIVVLRTAGCLP
jgi:hypothetical protein